MRLSSGFQKSILTIVDCYCRKKVLMVMMWYGGAPAGESMFPPVSISNVFPICAIWHRFQHFNPENVFILVHKLLQLELLPFMAIKSDV